LFKHYLESEERAEVDILPGRPTTGKKKGKRLDRWIKAVYPRGKVVYFQTEIKNWSAHAIGGTRISLSANEDQLKTHRMERWSAVWNTKVNRPLYDHTAKVLHRMKSPEGADPAHDVRPLLIFWYLLHPKGKRDCFFKSPVRTRAGEGDFDEVSVFSMSSYLRRLSKRTIGLEMPEASMRLEWLDKMLSGA
jgi:hypothetical protein